MKDRKVSITISIPTKSLVICSDVIKEKNFKNISNFIDSLINEYANKHEIKPINASGYVNVDKS
jgi:hypothetical protein